MKLNHDSVRNLLLDLEENLSLIDMIELNKDNTSEDDLYAALKLIEAGYIDANVQKFFGGDFIIFIKSITWSGHEFLDNIRENKSWEKSKEIVSKIGSASIKIVSEIAAKITSELISRQLGS